MQTWYNIDVRELTMEVEAGMNIENLTLLCNATLKMIVLWWPIILFAVIGIFVVARHDKQLLEKR